MKSNDDTIYPLVIAFDQLLGSERAFVENVGPLFDRLKEMSVAPFGKVTRSNLFSSFLTYSKDRFRG